MRKLFSTRMSKLLLAPSLLTSSLLVVPYSAFAVGVCEPVYGVGSYTATLQGDIGSSFNKAGTELLSKFTWSENGFAYTIQCFCFPENERVSSTYYWGKYNAGISQGHAPGWYSVNEYLDIRTEVAIWNGNIGTSQYHRVPFGPVANNTSEVCPRTAYLVSSISSGGSGKMDLYIKKAFVGNVSFYIPEVYSLSASLVNNASGPPVAVVGLNVSVTAPQSCEINAGQNISIPFNDIPQRNFVAAGKGGMPAGVVPQSKTLSLKCSNMDAYANLDMRFIGTADPSSTTDGFSTNNKDIAIAIEGPNGRLTPTTGKLPLQLDANQNGSVTIKTYPFSSTGLAPTVGKYSSIVTVRLDFR